MDEMVLRLLKEIQSNDDNSEITELNLIYEIVSTTDLQVLHRAISIDQEDYLPVTVRIILLRRLVELERNEHNLRELATYLLLHGPVWDKEANELLAEAISFKG